MIRSSEGTDKSGGETTRWEQEVERETQLVDRNEEAECFLEKKPKKVMLAGDSHMNCQNFGSTIGVVPHPQLKSEKKSPDGPPSQVHFSVMIKQIF